ncbi:MAG: hypothetical protein WA160_08185 [Pseudobdellovibrio sp.]
MKNIFLLLISLLCFNLSQAQFESLQKAASIPNAAPIPTGPTAPQSNTGTDPNDPLNTLLNTAKPAPPTLPTAPPAAIPGPKYEEYQSICRTHEYDQVRYLSDTLKAKRIELLQEKVKREPDSVKVKTRLLKEFVDQRRKKEAEQTLAEIRSLKTTSIELNIAEALTAYARSEKKKARDLLTKVLTEQPKNIEALKILAEIYKTDANYFEATTIYFDLQKITNSNYDEQLCELLTLDSHYAEAEKFCLKGALENKNSDFFIYLGIGAREKGNLEDAQKYFLSSLKLKESEMSYVCSGEIFQMQKKSDEAQDSFKKAIDLNPKSLRAYIALAWSLFNSKNQLNALDSFKKACSLDAKTNFELRKALKILLAEKSELIKRYSEQIEHCLIN